MQETWVQSLSLEGALEEGMATHSNIVCCLGKPMHRGAWAQSMGCQKVGQDLATKQQQANFSLQKKGEM